MIEAFFRYLSDHFSILLDRLAQHINISFSATLIALIISIPAGIWIKQQTSARGPVLGLANIFQTIPSLALLAFLVPFLGIGFNPTITTLTIYAFLPIIRNTYTGLRDVPKNTIEAANALGFTYWQRLRLVELPLATPIILSGIRIAVAATIGITTIAAFIGAGGLGDFITSGLSLSDNKLILLGAIPTALLALAVDFVIGNIESGLAVHKTKVQRLKKTRFIISSIIVIFLVAVLARYFYKTTLVANHRRTIVIASKNFTEQYILANIMADIITEKTNIRVIKEFNLATTSIIQSAMVRKDVDLYVEYTGTAYLLILKYKKLLDAEKTLATVRRDYKKKYQLIWLKPFGFANAQTLAVKKSFARRHNTYTLSQLSPLSPDLTIAAPPEFLSRPDSYPLLQKYYGFNFKKILNMEPTLMYKAIANNDVQVIEVFTTDGRIMEYQLQPLKDNKHVYPPYDAVPVIREKILKKYPKIGKALDLLAGKINQKTMVHLNYLVDVKKESPEKVARDFVKSLDRFTGNRSG